MKKKTRILERLTEGKKIVGKLKEEDDDFITLETKDGVPVKYPTFAGASAALNEAEEDDIIEISRVDGGHEIDILEAWPSEK